MTKLPRATLQLVPRSVQVRDLLQRTGHNPKLQLMASPSKTITKVIEHLTGKWLDTNGTPLALAPICLWPRRALSRLKDAYPVTTSALTHGGLPATVMDLFDDVAAMSMPLVIEYDWHIINEVSFESFEECFESPISPPQSSPPAQLGVLATSSPQPTLNGDENHYFTDHHDHLSQELPAAPLPDVLVGVSAAPIDENSLGFLELRNFLAGNASQPPIAVLQHRQQREQQQQQPKDHAAAPSLQRTPAVTPASPTRTSRTVLGALHDVNATAAAEPVLNFLNDSWFDEKSQSGDGVKRGRTIWSPPSSPLKRRHTDEPINTTHDDIGASHMPHTSDWLYSFAL